MNKKMIVTAVVAALVLGLMVVGLTSAQTLTGGRGPGGMRNGAGIHRTVPPQDMGPMHEAMLNALAEGLGLTRADLDARLAAGETPYTIAQAQGLTDEEFTALMQAARAAAIAQAVVDGTLTQEQATWMLSHNMQGMGANMHSGGMGNMMGGGMGAGMHGGGMGAGMRGGMMGTGTCPYATPAP